MAQNFDDLPEPMHRRITFWEFLKHTWYWYLIVIPSIVLDEEILEWIFWLAYLLNDPYN